MGQSGTVAPPSWVHWAADVRSREDVGWAELARRIKDTHGVDVEWHRIRNEVNRHLPPAPPPLLPWRLPVEEADAYVAPRLRLLVAEHRGRQLKSWEAARVEALLSQMRRFGGAEVIRWDGVSWEMRRRREGDRGYNPQWYPDLLVR